MEKDNQNNQANIADSIRNDWELILLTYNYMQQTIHGFTMEEIKFFNDVLNHDFRKIFNSTLYPNNEFAKYFNILIRSIALITDNLQGNIQANLNQFKSILLKFHEKTQEKLLNSDRIIFLAFFTLHSMFMKESWLGKSFLYKDADYKLKKEGQEKMKKLGWNEYIKTKVTDTFDYNQLAIELGLEKDLLVYSKDLNLNKYSYQYLKSEEFINKRSKDIQEYLIVDGEEIYRKLPYMSLFVVLKYLLETLKTTFSSKFWTLDLWLARIYFIHNKILNERMTSLQDIVIQKYQNFVDTYTEKLIKYPNMLICLYSEYGNALLYYYKYEKSLQYFKMAQDMLGLNIKITGKLGIKTKFQSFKTAQLVVEASKDKKNEVINEKNEDKDLSINPKSISIEEVDDMTVLLEKPKIEDLQTDNLKKELRVYDQIVVLSLIYHLQKTNPRDEILQEQVTAYLRIIMEASKNWLVFSTALFVRSMNEFSRVKTKERSLLQLQTLSDQFNDKEPGMTERIKYAYCLYYPCRLEMQKILAEKYMEIGMLMSSCKLFESFEMYEECVECLASSGHLEAAKERALKSIEEKPTPKMLCIYGELTNSLEYYKKAWKLSSKKLARSQRCIARYHFNKGNFEKSIKAYKKALNINGYHISSLFTLGCAYLKLKDYPNAVVNFSKIVQIDETQGEAWANMAVAFSMQNKKMEAYNALRQAVKHHENNWKMWQSLLYISLENKKFSTYIDCIERLINLHQKSCIDDPVLQKLNQIYEYHIVTCTYSTVTSMLTIKKRIENLYKYMIETIGEISEVWSRYGDFIILHNEYADKLKYLLEATSNQKSTNNAHLNKLIEDLLNDCMTSNQIKDKVAEIRMKECHSIMIIDWENNKTQCKKLESAIKKLKQAYEDLGDEIKLTQLKIFLEANIPKINKVLNG